MERLAFFEKDLDADGTVCSWRRLDETTILVQLTPSRKVTWGVRFSGPDVLVVRFFGDSSGEFRRQGTAAASAVQLGKATATAPVTGPADQRNSARADTPVPTDAPKKTTKYEVEYTGERYEVELEGEHRPEMLDEAVKIAEDFYFERHPKPTGSSIIGPRSDEAKRMKPRERPAASIPKPTASQPPSEGYVSRGPAKPKALPTGMPPPPPPPFSPTYP